MGESLLARVFHRQMDMAERKEKYDQEREEREKHKEEQEKQEKKEHHIQNYTTEQCQITSEDNINPEEIPELEEDLDNSQFTDTDSNLINRHNTHFESERFRREYTQHLLDLSDNQYYYKENSINQLQYSCPDPDYYGTPSRRSQTQPHDPNGYYPPIRPRRHSMLACTWKRKTCSSTWA